MTTVKMNIQSAGLVQPMRFCIWRAHAGGAGNVEALF